MNRSIDIESVMAARDEEAAREALIDEAIIIIARERAEEVIACVCPWCDPATVGPAILALFEAAPKMKALHLPGLRIGRAGKASSNPGGLWITDGGAWGESTYFGRINADGSFRARPELGSDAREMLRRLAAFGAAEIARIGKATGRCVYCDAYLDDPISVALGYGPVCARHHGLPHGKKAVEAAA